MYHPMHVLFTVCSYVFTPIKEVGGIYAAYCNYMHILIRNFGSTPMTEHHSQQFWSKAFHKFKGENHDELKNCSHVTHAPKLDFARISKHVWKLLQIHTYFERKAQKNMIAPQLSTSTNSTHAVRGIFYAVLFHFRSQAHLTIYSSIFNCIPF